METAISPSLPSPGVITVFEPSYARYLQSEYAELSKFDVSARSLSPFLCTEALFFFFYMHFFMFSTYSVVWKTTKNLLPSGLKW